MKTKEERLLEDKEAIDRLITEVESELNDLAGRIYVYKREMGDNSPQLKQRAYDISERARIELLNLRAEFER